MAYFEVKRAIERLSTDCYRVDMFGVTPVFSHIEYGSVSPEQILKLVNGTDIVEAYNIALTTGNWSIFISLLDWDIFDFKWSHNNPAHLYDQVPGQPTEYDR